MRGPEVLPVSVNKNSSTYTENGALVSVSVKIKEQKTATNGTAIHEAQHIVAAETNGTAVVRATIVRNGDALGSTQLSRPDPVAAMAPHSVGSSGTSWDVFITTAMGANPDAAASVARTIVTQNSHKVNKVAVVLEEKMTIYNGDVRSAMNDAEKDKEKGPEKEISVFVKDTAGRRQTFTDNNFRGEVVLIPNTWSNIGNEDGEQEDDLSKGELIDESDESKHDAMEYSAEIITFPSVNVRDGELATEEYDVAA